MFVGRLSITYTVNINSNFSGFGGLCLRDVELVKIAVIHEFIEPATGTLVGLEPAF